MPAHDVLNPERPPRFDAPALGRRLGRVFLLAPAIAILLVLAAAGAASAADGLDLVEAAQVAPIVPPVDPVTKVAPVVRVLGSGAAQAAKAIVGGAEDKLGSVAPVPIPPVVPPALYPGPDHVVQSGQPQPRAADAEPTPVRSITTSLVPDQASSVAGNEAHELDDHLPLRALQPVTPLGPIDAAGTGAIGVSGTGPGPWLGNGSSPRVPPAGLSGFPPAVPFTMPRGLTPRPLVPPG